MAPSEAVEAEALQSVCLAAADVFAGVGLSSAAGWNQTTDDWALFIAQGEAIGLRTARSELVATAATLPYEGGHAWISMVLVDPAWQHRGLATRLLAQCIESLRARRMVPTLDATPAGEAVYRKLGFLRGFGFSRWERDAAASTAAEAVDPRVREATQDELADCMALDTQACGLGRAALLASLAGRQGSRAWRLDDARGLATGFVIAREGRRAAQIGPLVAAGDAQAIGLLRAALAATPGPVFIDVPDAREALSGWLIAHGFRLQRSFMRMALRAQLPPYLAEAPSSLFAVAGPEFG
ncbi:GNAT family N-acetyltransferase [Xenophilus aerolatus]|nr:GNAT family N-acetyltransferase [Xenophilus aerolatus]